MAQAQSLSQMKDVFKNKMMIQFLDDAYHLSGSDRTREVYRQVLYSFNRFCNTTYAKNLLGIIETIKEKPLEDALGVFLDYKRYLDNHLNQNWSTCI